MVPLRTHILTFMNFRPDHGIQCTVQPTDTLSRVLPMAPIISTSTKIAPKTLSNMLLSFKSRILLLGQSEELEIKLCEGETVAVEPVEHNDKTSTTYDFRCRLTLDSWQSIHIKPKNHEIICPNKKESQNCIVVSNL